ncbi:MAG: HEPN domain-containing protein [Pseudobdellovibrionaceae bacterium]|jgi:HEPN domain-containing protein
MSQYTPTWKVWLQKANTDLLAAQLMLNQNNDRLLEISVYHSQQTAEKAIKGFLTYHKLRFGKTHIIRELVDLIEKLNPAFAEVLRPADQLSIYAIAFRYPEETQDQIPLNRTTAENAFKIASWALKEVQAKLPSE